MPNQTSTPYRQSKAKRAYTNVVPFCTHGVPLAQNFDDDYAFTMLGPPLTTWHTDDEGHIILLRLPAGINLEPVHHNHQMPTITLASLSSDIIHIILTHLHPIDRTCLALTNKSLCFSVLVCPVPAYLPTYSSSTESLLANNYFFPLALPSLFSLTLRLAYGWVDKAKWRYCWHCHLILPTHPPFWHARFLESIPTPSRFPSSAMGHLAPHRWRHDCAVGSGCDDGGWGAGTDILEGYQAKAMVPSVLRLRLSGRERLQILIKRWCSTPPAPFDCVACRQQQQQQERDRSSSSSSSKPSDPSVDYDTAGFASNARDSLSSSSSAPASTSPLTVPEPSGPTPTVNSPLMHHASAPTNEDSAPTTSIGLSSPNPAPTYPVQCPTCCMARLQKRQHNHNRKQKLRLRRAQGYENGFRKRSAWQMVRDWMGPCLFVGMVGVMQGARVVVELARRLVIGLRRQWSRISGNQEGNTSADG